jgi:dsDNA-specific endonuclease/ATPase MutS2
VVASYLEAAWEAGFQEVRLIHGRGIGVQRESVRALLARHRTCSPSPTRRRSEEDGAPRWSA